MLISGVKYVQAFATGIDFQNKKISCIDLYEHFEDDVKLPRNEFKLDYDSLVLATGTDMHRLKNDKVPTLFSPKNLIFTLKKECQKEQVFAHL